MFGTNSSLSTASSFRPASLFGTAAVATQAATHNPMKDFEVVQPPDDSIQAMKFSPPVLQSNFLVSGSWDNVVITRGSLMQPVAVVNVILSLIS